MQMNRATFTIFNGRFSLTATDTIKNHLLSTENEYYWRPMWLIFILADTSTLLGFFFYLSRVSSFFLEILHLCYRSGIPRNTFIITPPPPKKTPIQSTQQKELRHSNLHLFSSLFIRLSYGEYHSNRSSIRLKYFYSFNQHRLIDFVHFKIVFLIVVVVGWEVTPSSFASNCELAPISANAECQSARIKKP